MFFCSIWESSHINFSVASRVCAACSQIRLITPYLQTKTNRNGVLIRFFLMDFFYGLPKPDIVTSLVLLKLLRIPICSSQKEYSNRGIIIFIPKQIYQLRRNLYLDRYWQILVTMEKNPENQGLLQSMKSCGKLSKKLTTASEN